MNNGKNLDTAAKHEGNLLVKVDPDLEIRTIAAPPTLPPTLVICSHTVFDPEQCPFNKVFRRCPEIWSDWASCTSNHTLEEFKNGCQRSFVSPITAIKVTDLKCTFYPNDNCNADIRDPHTEFFQIPYLQIGRKYREQVYDLRLLSKNGTKSGRSYTKPHGSCSS
ncbi:hypothetical protein Vi05172_g2022 [Venturia inaequalis]|nr:hypothetical protein Vi05172_g2022 [Venturia inaequalis]